MSVRITYPEDPEIWSESLTPPEGVWSGGYNTNVYLDTVNKASGLASIRATTENDFYYCRVIFELHTPIDCTFWDKLHFLHCLQAERDFTGECAFGLVDVNGKHAFRYFGTSPVGPPYFESKDFDLGFFDDVEPGFDFTKVKTIIIDAQFAGQNTGSQWIDKIYFSAPYVPPPKFKLLIESSPSGKNFVIEGTGGLTPTEYQVTEGTYTVSMEPDGFKKWEDGSTNPVRSIYVNKDTAIKADYEGAPPPPPDEWLPYAIGFGILLGTGLLLIIE